MLWSTIIQIILFGLGLFYWFDSVPTDSDPINDQNPDFNSIQFSKRSAADNPSPMQALPIPASLQSHSNPIHKEALESSHQDAETTGSHSILAVGWPATSPVWPTIETIDSQASSNSTSSVKTNLTEPFIYFDKLRDYNLLLNPDKRVRELLRNMKSQLEARLSFSYYFNFASKVTKMPSIKIETDGHLLEHLEPNLNQTNTSRLWLNYNKIIDVPDSIKIDADDWLTITMKVREQPSLVAIRRLKIELDPTVKSTNKNNKPPKNVPSSYDDADDYIPETSTISSGYSDRRQSTPIPTKKSSSSWMGRRKRDASGSSSSSSTGLEADAVQSGQSLGTNVQQSQQAANNNTNPTVITLTCFKANACDWLGDKEPIMWSLARMPPSTDSVKNGYYYVSNRDNYGDATKLLRLSLNETEQVTVQGQKSDHCLRIALYITEQARVNLYRMTLNDQPVVTSAAARTNYQLPLVDSVEQPNWTKGNLLLSWSSTLTNGDSSTLASTSNSDRKSFFARPGPKNSRLTSIDSNQMGWTYEQLCFGDFFINVRDCSLGKCAFAFEMELLQNGVPIQLRATLASGQDGGEPDTVQTDTSAIGVQLQQQQVLAEQVVGIALLRQFSDLKVHQPDSTRLKWLESWSRPEIKPTDSWRFFPSQDVTINWRNVSLINLYEDAQYHVQSEWLEFSSNMTMLGRLQIALLQSEPSSLANSTIANQTILAEHRTTNNDNDDDDHDIENSFIRMNQDQSGAGLVLDMTSRLVDQNFTTLYSTNTTIIWPPASHNQDAKIEILNLTSHEINLPVNALLKSLSSSSSLTDLKLLKIVLDFSIRYTDLKRLHDLEKMGAIKLLLDDFSLSDRCFANPCNSGQCTQKGTGPDEISCTCPEEYRGIRCELGNWCQVAHVSAWQPSSSNISPNSGAKPIGQKPTAITIRPPQAQPQRKPRIDTALYRVSGREYCKQKLGLNAKCTDFDLPLNKDQYDSEGTTFSCSCQDGFYLNDEFKCRQAHLCNSILCPGPGLFCDESKPFNQTQPCQCDQSQGWFADELEPSKCQRRQCADRKADCHFDAHICLPTLPDEKSICKCDIGFTLVTQDKDGSKSCQSIACNLPSLNNCEHICRPNNNDRVKPFTCECHPGYTLQSDGHSCSPISATPATNGKQPSLPVQCRTSCHKDTQICTQFGCKCKQGYLAENEITIQKIVDGSEITYTQSLRCINICSVSFGDSKQPAVRDACPLGTCDPNTFACKCSITNSQEASVLSISGSNKYEPDVPDIYGNGTTSSNSPASHVSNLDATGKGIITRASLCRLKRVCEPGSPSFKVCQNQGAFCVPDYTKTAMFDCLCPPSTEKHQSSSLVSDFTCEPRCNNSKSDCLRRMAVCKLYDKNQAKCECMPGFIENPQNQICYLAKYSYSFSLQIVNRYYEPEDTFYSLVRNANNVTSSELVRAFKYNPALKPQHLSQQNQHQEQQQQPAIVEKNFRRIYNPSYNQCNITQIIPQTVLEDRYDHDLESLLNYIEQCNRLLNQDMETHYLYHRIAEDIKKTLKQHLTDFSLITKESSCYELDATGKYLNCTLYLQSMHEPVSKEILERIFGQCDKPGIGDEFCWIKPRILIKKLKPTPPPLVDSPSALITPDLDKETSSSFGNYKQIIPCELKGFCDINSHSVRLDNRTSLCSCRCNQGIEPDDVKQLQNDEMVGDINNIAIREMCVPRDHCENNPEFCVAKPNSKCHYDRRHGSKCICEYPAYEFEGMCKESSDQSRSAIWTIIILLVVVLAISMLFNIWAASKAKSGCGKSKQYQLNEFPASPTFRRPNNRSTGVPNPAFSDEE